MTFTEAGNAYLASQRLGRRPHRPRRQPQVMPVGFTMARARSSATPGQRSGCGTITFGELLTHRAGFRLDSGLVFETDDAAREQIRQGVQQVDQRAADYININNNINFTIFKDMLPLMEGAPGRGQPCAPQRRTASSSTMFSVRYSIQWVSRTPGARQSAMPCPCTRRPAPGPHGAGQPRWDRRRAWKGMVDEAAWC